MASEAIPPEGRTESQRGKRPSLGPHSKFLCEVCGAGRGRLGNKAEPKALEWHTERYPAGSILMPMIINVPITDTLYIIKIGITLQTVAF